MINEIYYRVLRYREVNDFADDDTYSALANKFRSLGVWDEKHRLIAFVHLLPPQYKWRHKLLCRQYHYDYACVDLIDGYMFSCTPQYYVDFLTQFRTLEALQTAEMILNFCWDDELKKNGYKYDLGDLFRTLTNPKDGRLQYRRYFMKVENKPYYHRSSIENTLAQRPRYNPFACGHGAHADKTKPSRAKRKENFRKELKFYGDF